MLGLKIQLAYANSSFDDGNVETRGWIKNYVLIQ